MKHWCGCEASGCGAEKAIKYICNKVLNLYVELQMLIIVKSTKRWELRFLMLRNTAGPASMTHVMREDIIIAA